MSVLPSLLRPFPSLSELSDPDRASMAGSLVEVHFRAGAQICREGDAGDACFLLVAGRVEVSKLLPDGRRIFLAHLGPGAIFGQGALVPGQCRSADVRAEGNVQVFSLRSLEHKWALDQGLGWAIALQQLICVNVIRQLRSALTRLSDLANTEHPELFGEFTSGSSPKATAKDASSTRQDSTAPRRPEPSLPVVL